MIDIFDPCLSGGRVYYMFSFFFIFSLFRVWPIFRGGSFLLHKMFVFFKNEFFAVLRKTRWANAFSPLSIFIVVIINLLGFFPYIFAVSSQPLFTFFFSLIVVLPIFINAFRYNNSLTVAHLTPKNRPTGLIFILVLIELISLLIRPITLRLRLAVNIMAGHVIRSLIGGAVTSLCLPAIGAYFGQFFIVLLESGVCLVQGYVFGLLYILYLKDAV